MEEEEEIPGEQAELKSVPGEGAPAYQTDIVDHIQLSHVIEEKSLSFEEASRCLNTLGKDESGIRYAYLMLSATDRKLTNVRTILNFKHVLFVDVSGNYLTLDGIQVLTEMPYLVLLKAERNLIESAALNRMPFLQVLDLNRNRITETCDIDQPLLECLELNYNEIYTAQFDAERLAGLKQLELRGNHLLDISGNFPLLVENLYLAENKISRIISPDLAKLENLKILHLRNNNIRKLNGFTEHLVNLNYLNLRENKITKLRQFRKLVCLRKLETLIISENPVAGKAAVPQMGEEEPEEAAEEEEFGEDGPPKDAVRIGLLVVLPNLKRINKEPVNFDERNAAYDLRDRKWEEIMAEDSSEDETEVTSTTGFTTDRTSDVDERRTLEEDDDDEEDEEEDTEDEM